MKQLTRALSPLFRTPLPIGLVAAACGGLDRDAQTTPTAEAPPLRTAGNVGLGIAPDRPEAEIAALRARGREALVELFATYDATREPAKRAALAATIDKVAGQRYATVSRLYWYTDLDAARAEATSTGKPILSLRMLGRLDEDLSCANSRFFRTVLYPDPAVAAMLRDKVVLHWSSERAVPRVTIDFGDGRTLERTVTGNSIHYLLDADGRPFDALPGMYAPSVFRAELDRSLDFHRQLARAADAPARTAMIATYHAGRVRELDAQWSTLGSQLVLDVSTGRVLRGAAQVDALAKAQRATMSKARVEAPELVRLDIGTDPTALLPDVDTWASIGMAVYGFGAPEAGAKPSAAMQPPPMMQPAAAYFPGETIAARRKVPGGAEAAAAGTASLGVLSREARALVLDVMAGAPEAEAVIAQLERSVIADTAINQLSLRHQLHDWIARTPTPSFDQLDRYVYDDLFSTPASDPWLGLLPRDVYTGLPGDGVVVRR